MTDTTKTVKSSGGDYSTVSAWEAGQQKSITSGDREIADCYNFLDTTEVTIDGWTVSSGAEMIIRAATGQGHNGTAGTGYRLVTSGAGDTLTINEDRVTLDRLEVRYTGSGGTSGALKTANLLVSAVAKNCLFERTGNAWFAVWTNFNGQHSSNMTFVNCQIMGGASGIAFDYGTIYLYNCTIIAKTGNALFNGNNPSVLIKNCYMYAPSAIRSDNGTGDPTYTTCRHSTSESITGSTGSTAYNTTNFTNVTSGSEDLKLPSGSALIDAGTDLSGDANYAFSTDFQGTTRSGTWDVGFHEYVAASTGHPTMKRWAGVPGMSQTNSIGRGW